MLGEKHTGLSFPSDIIQNARRVGWAVGDKVIVAPGFPHDPSEWDTVPENEATSYYPTGTYGWGGYAQEMEVAARWLIRDDTGLAPEELATIPLVLVTAIHAVKTLGRVGPASKVLVQAGASGTGSMAIQVAKALGAQVVATVSTVEKAALAHRLGADKVIRYCHTNVSAAVRNWTAGAGVDVSSIPSEASPGGKVRGLDRAERSSIWG